MKNKKGQIAGGFIVDVPTIIIVSLLLIFFIISTGIIRALDDSQAGVRVAKEWQVGLIGLEDYMKENYLKVIDLRKEVRKGGSVKDILKKENEK